MKSWVSYLSLFASTGTLFCCALPSLLVFLGMGASMAGLVSVLPQLVWLSQYKGFVFSLSGLLILSAAALQYQARNQACPIDPLEARACQKARLWSNRIIGFSAVIWLVGAFFAFLAPRLF